MANKKLTIILYGADRQLWSSGKATLRVTAFDSQGFETLWVRGHGPRSRKNISVEGPIIELELDLPFNAGQVYGVHVEAKRHRRAFQVVNRRTFLRQEGIEQVERAEAICRLLLVPKSAGSSDLADAFEKLIDRGSPLVRTETGLSREAFAGLSDANKMAFLNIEAKLRATVVGGRTLLGGVSGLRRVEPDRLFVMMSEDIKELIAVSPDFASAPGHGSPPGEPKLPKHPDSWKHRLFGSGNVQLSFSKASLTWPVGSSGRSFSVDVDIDLEQGLAHLGEWLSNNVFKPGQKTDQSVVYALLVAQGVIPDYTLNPVS